MLIRSREYIITVWHDQLLKSIACQFDDDAA